MLQLSAVTCRDTHRGMQREAIAVRAQRSEHERLVTCALTDPKVTMACTSFGGAQSGRRNSGGGAQRYTQGSHVLRMIMITRLPEDAQTVYAEKLAMLLA